MVTVPSRSGRRSTMDRTHLASLIDTGAPLLCGARDPAPPGLWSLLLGTLCGSRKTTQSPGSRVERSPAPACTVRRNVGESNARTGSRAGPVPAAADSGSGRQTEIPERRPGTFPSDHAGTFGPRLLSMMTNLDHRPVVTDDLGRLDAHELVVGAPLVAGRRLPADLHPKPGVEHQRSPRWSVILSPPL